MSLARRRVVITGAPGSGKTSVLRELAASGFTCVEEPARVIIAEQRDVDGDGVYDRNPQRFLDLMLERSIADYRGVEGSGPVFFDRGIPDIIGYAELFGLDPSEAASASAAHEYSDPVFVLPSWREIYITDGDRRMSFEAAQAFGEGVRDIYVGLGYTISDLPCDTAVARARFILEALA